MPLTPRRILSLLGIVLVLLIGATTPVLAAGPRLMIVYGTPLHHRVVITNWGDNEGIMVAANDDMSVLHAHLTGRPFLHLALFWGEEWVRYMRQRKSITALRPTQANQFARFYPAYGAAPPLLVFASIPGPYTSLIRRIRPYGLAILARYGIPIRLPLRSYRSQLPSFAWTRLLSLSPIDLGHGVV